MLAFNSHGEGKGEGKHKQTVLYSVRSGRPKDGRSIRDKFYSITAGYAWLAKVNAGKTRRDMFGKMITAQKRFRSSNEQVADHYSKCKAITRVSFFLTIYNQSYKKK